eukprot:751605-Rhodomonas_salina.1
MAPPLENSAAQHMAMGSVVPPMPGMGMPPMGMSGLGMAPGMGMGMPGMGMPGGMPQPQPMMGGFAPQFPQQGMYFR